uniref:Cartilage intermediate layer protein, nucleotide pyrophosphohydrolase n=1 Tax=Callorhinchus milii TaxID=7868 RepID=A0A4W3K3R6_CALMI
SGAGRGSQWEWTSWFNIDHPGGSGDYERLEGIRHYYRERVCRRPAELEARTADWMPAANTREVVHSDPQHGFWCINKEQRPGKLCSNYAVRFKCPKGSYWSHWSEWSSCPATCNQTGVQNRRRTCSTQGRRWEQKCLGPVEEGRMCKGTVCAGTTTTTIHICTASFKSVGGPKVLDSQRFGPEQGVGIKSGCELRCPMGHANAQCDACMCEDYLLYGTVHLQDGAPASRATIYLQGNTDKFLMTCDDKGKFRIPGLCPDGRTTIKIKKEKYRTEIVTLRMQSFERFAFLCLTDKPYITKHPVSKARREGESVTFCCKVQSDPPPHKYLWYHNSSLLDSKKYRYDSMLVLRQLQMRHTGQYYCKASNSAGSIKSWPASLTIIAQDSPSCNPKPESYLIRLPYDCYQNQSRSFYYDVGRCPVTTCAGERDQGLQCKDTTAYCCGAVELEERTVACSGHVLPIKAVSRCGCQRCVETKAVVRGRALAADNGEPMRFGYLFMDGKRISMTGYKGTFSIQVPMDIDRLVLTFVDRYQKFVNTTKVLPFNKKGGAVFHEIKLLRKQPAVTLDCTISNTISLGGTERQDPVAELEIPPNSFYRQNGDIYSGKVQASVTFLDPRDISLASAAQSDLNFIDEEGAALPLRSYGMFSVDFTDESATESLNAGQVKVFLDSAQVKMPQHLKRMKLWSLNPKTGYWDEEGDFTFVSQRRGKREERTFLVGNMEIRERRLFNLDVPESRRCYLKARAFRGDRFMPSEQVEGVVVTLINMEPMAGSSSNPRAWGRFDSVITGSNGACVPAFCDDQRVDAYSAYVKATLGGEELEAVESFPKMNPYSIGVPQPYLNKLHYRRSDHEDPKVKKTAFKINVAKPRANMPEETNGPIYPYEKLKECEEALFSAAHFRFYRVEGDGYDYNTVPFNEDDPMSWTEDYLAWWPKPLEFRACYLKVKLVGPKEITVRSRNMGGTHPRTVGRLYGIRDVRSARDMDRHGVSTVCLEFKCSGVLYDQERVDRTLVKIIPQASCRRENVNNMLQEYLVNHLPLAVNNNTNEFTMLAPLDPLGHNYGIYTVTDQDPRTAKEIALGRCFDGSSDTTSRVMRSSLGVAMTFNCEERQLGQRSAFQTMRNPPGQSIVSPFKVGRGRRDRQQRHNLLYNRFRMQRVQLKG